MSPSKYLWSVLAISNARRVGVNSISFRSWQDELRNLNRGHHQISRPPVPCEWVGRAHPLCPVASHVDLLRDCQGSARYFQFYVLLDIELRRRRGMRMSPPA